MLDFRPITPKDKALYAPYLSIGHKRGCEFSFANLCLWGFQQATIFENHMVLFSQFYGLTVYPFPLGKGDKKPVLDAIMADAKKRGIPCHITGLDADAKQTLETLYPGMFHYHCSPGAFDYVYDIHDLADLKGRKYHRKRNHYNRFRETYPQCSAAPLSGENLPLVREMIDTWYETKLRENPDADFQMEQDALYKALEQYQALDMDGLVLRSEGQVLAFTLGSQMNEDTFDVHFEKARPEADGAYAAINCEFAQYIRSKYPHILYLDREEDMGIEGLRKAKQSYYPHHQIEKCRAVLLNN
ncbi:MAG: DUF2156 domain-containing protein [Lachnospiraceae bacterium]|nr:DUF2156 domain-containing protein [Lachnospiraceae bacterium]